MAHLRAQNQLARPLSRHRDASLTSPAAPPSAETYTVVTRGVEFILSRSQVESDSPNVLTAAFLGDFTESRSRIVRTDRHPLLFTLFLEHLSGYKILPLQSAALPPTMSLESGLENLTSDALYFGLDKLHALLVGAGVERNENIRKEGLEKQRPEQVLRTLGHTNIIEVSEDWKDVATGAPLVLQLDVSELGLEPGRTWYVDELLKT